MSMTLNADFAGARLLVDRQKLRGSDRGLDVLVGLVILVAEALIGLLVVSSLFVAGTDAMSVNSAAGQTVSVGFAVAGFGSAIVVAITTLIYLVRISTGRRSWRGTVMGAVLMTVVLIIGYAIMASAL